MSVAARLEERVADEFGLLVRPERRDDLGAFAEAISRECGVHVDDLDRHLEQRPQLLHELAEALTVGETHFFRHSDDFRVMVEIVASALATEPPDAQVHLWSAGCASGEEPYSMAMAIHAALGPAALARVRILATDVNRASLARARSGVYSAWSFRDVPPSIVQRYFTTTANGLTLAPGPVRDAVQLDLSGLEQRARRLPCASVDVVFFRNVGIYWRGDALDRLYRELARALKPEGVLLIGPADPRPRDCSAVRWVTRFDHVTALAASHSAVAVAPLLRTEPPGGRRSITKPKPRAAVARRSKPPIAPRHVAVTPLHSRASALGDAGDVARAIDAASQLIENEPASPSGYLLRGQIRLSQDRCEDAVRDLRSAVFLAPDGFVARYWYACALHRAGDSARALQQLHELRRRLALSSPAAVVEDDETRASELLAAATFLEDSIR